MKRYLIFFLFMLFMFYSNVFPPVAAQDTTMEELKKSIILLKQIVEEQDKRIKVLEKEVSELKGTKPIASSGEERTSESAIKQNEWKVGSNWDKIKNGMSEMQVISILGKPTSVEELIPFKTIFYRGEVSVSGFVSGNVKLMDDRVWQVNKPVF